MQPPMSKMHLPSLYFLHLGDNNVYINNDFNKDAFPNLIDLYLNGNNLTLFPSESLKHTIKYLGVARCGIRSLPSYLSEFKSLQYLDARDNEIRNVENNLKKLIEGNSVESYFSGNPACSTDSELDCKPLCSKTCWRRVVTDNGVCDESCNTEDCEFDGGDCKL